MSNKHRTALVHGMRDMKQKDGLFIWENETLHGTRYGRSINEWRVGLADTVNDSQDHWLKYEGFIKKPSQPVPHGRLRRQDVCLAFVLSKTIVSHRWCNLHTTTISYVSFTQGRNKCTLSIGPTADIILSVKNQFDVRRVQYDTRHTRRGTPKPRVSASDARLQKKKAVSGRASGLQSEKQGKERPIFHQSLSWSPKRRTKVSGPARLLSP